MKFKEVDKRSVMFDDVEKSLAMNVCAKVYNVAPHHPDAGARSQESPRAGRGGQSYVDLLK